MNSFRIYKISCPERDRSVYVGQTCRDVDVRFYHHLRDGNKCRRLANYLRACVREGFAPRIEELCGGLTLDEANEIETACIEYLDMLEAEGVATKLNLSYGGANGTHCSETRAVMSAKAKARGPLPFEIYRRNSKRFTGEGNPFYGRRHSEETRTKIREGRRKNPPQLTEGGRQRIGAAHKARVKPSEQRAKIARSLERLTSEAVHFARGYLRNDVPVSVVAQIFGVSVDCIYNLKKGRTYTHVPEFGPTQTSFAEAA